MKMTKIALALAAIGMSAVAFAGAPGNQVVAPSGVNLVAPDSVGVWSIGLEAMYVEPTNNEFTYGQNVSVNSAGNGYRFNNKSADNSWEWGGTVDLTYMFPGNSRDVKLAWTHMFSSSDSNHTSPGSGQYFAPAFGAPAFGPSFNGTTFGSGADAGSIASQTGTAKGSARTNYDAVDLVFGQWIKIGDRLDLHPFGGLRWARVDSTFKGRYYSATDTVNTTTGAPTNFNLYDYNKVTSNFDGIGPRAGFDTAVHLGSGFSIVGTFAGSLLVGDLNSKFTNNTTLYTSTNAGTTANAAGYKVKNSNNDTSIVPELDARLGLDYMYAFTPATSMNIQLGYQVVNYFNVTEADFVSSGNNETGAAFVNTTSSRQNWGYQGPYLRLQLNLA